MKFKFSSFTILNCFICMCIIGASMIPLLSIQLNPTKELPSLTITFFWNDSSAKVIEQEVTSKLEGVLNTVKGIEDISSTTHNDNGTIEIRFKKKTDMDVVRFEVANLLRQSYSELPAGVSYPQISLNNNSENGFPVLVYSVNANISPYQIRNYVDNQILPELLKVEGVNNIDVNGAEPLVWNIKYNSDQLLNLSISINEIETAVTQYFQQLNIGSGKIVQLQKSKNLDISVILVSKSERVCNFKTIPIKKIGKRIIYLGDIAQIRLREAPLKSYYRINGLSSVNILIYCKKGANNLDVAVKIKKTVNVLKKNIKGGFSLKLVNDSTEFIMDQLQKILEKMVVSITILIILILLITKSLKTAAILLISIIANLLIAIIFYVLFQVELQLYSFAGITISFGIIIDNCIIMLDHLQNKGDKKVFLAILATTLTILGALLSIFLIGGYQITNLKDFTLVIAINTGVSLFVSLFLIPALMEKINLDNKTKINSIRKKRFISSLSFLYLQAIIFLKKTSFNWLMFLLLVLGFGLPLHLLPKTIEGEESFVKFYNSVVGNDYFYNNVKPPLEKIIGGSLRLFTNNVYEKSHYIDPKRTVLIINGALPEGSTLEQLNEIFVKMEIFISSFKEIEMFETNIQSYKNASISIYFKKTSEKTDFPINLKSLLESKAISLGGVDWFISGVGTGFSNASNSENKFNGITIEGYNYDNLYSYAELLKAQLIENSFSRIKDVDIISERTWSGKKSHEFYINFDSEKMALGQVSQIELYNYLRERNYNGTLTTFANFSELQEVKLESQNYQKINLWDIKNDLITIGTRKYKLNQVTNLEKRNSISSITRANQQYRLNVDYDFIGTEVLSDKVKKENIALFTSKLPVGYRVFENSEEGWDKKDKIQYYFIIVIILIIFFICSILFESLKQPFAIVCMIPISFVGVFLTFYIFDLNFDQGGFASFILLCGISVNAAIYIVNDFNNVKKKFPKENDYKVYIKAFNYKIIPVLLTIMSTIAGLIPFIVEGQNEAFWFSFAAGSIGGLLFSLIGIFIYLPIFIIDKRIESDNLSNQICSIYTQN